MTLILIVLLFVGIGLVAFFERWWLIALGIVLCFVVKIIAPGPPPDEDYSGKGGEAMPRRIIIIQQ